MSKVRWSKPPAELTALIDPALEGAVCAGTAPLHDLEVDGETAAQRDARHLKAARNCRRCLVVAACYSAAEEHQSTGVWAGAVRIGPTQFQAEGKAS